MHPDFSAAKIGKKSAQITRANTVITQKEWCDVIKLAAMPPSYIDLRSNKNLSVSHLTVISPTERNSDTTQKLSNWS